MKTLRLGWVKRSMSSQVEFNVAFQLTIKIGKMLPFKDRVNNVHERSLVVYSFQCATCGV